MFGPGPSIDTCVDVLRDADLIVLEGETAYDNLKELEEIYDEKELLKAIEKWLDEKGKFVVSLEELAR